MTFEEWDDKHWTVKCRDNKHYELEAPGCTYVFNKHDFLQLFRNINAVADNIFEIVATVEDKVVGYLMLTKVWNPILQKYYCLVDYVCVSSSYRDGGVGKKLLDFAYQVAKGESAIYLQLTCSRFRIAAHHLYEKCNFIKRDSDIYRKEIL